MLLGVATHDASSMHEGTTLARAHSAPVSIDGLDAHADCITTWQVLTEAEAAGHCCTPSNRWLLCGQLDINMRNQLYEVRA